MLARGGEEEEGKGEEAWLQDPEAIKDPVPDLRVLISESGEASYSEGTDYHAS